MKAKAETINTRSTTVGQLRRKPYQTTVYAKGPSDTINQRRVK